MRFVQFAAVAVLALSVPAQAAEILPPYPFETFYDFEEYEVGTRLYTQLGVGFVAELDGNKVLYITTRRLGARPYTLFSNWQSRCGPTLYCSATTTFDILFQGGLKPGKEEINNQWFTRTLGPERTKAQRHYAAAYLDNISSIPFYATVPEPSTWAMLLIGFGAIGTALRRRRKITPSYRLQPTA